MHEVNGLIAVHGVCERCVVVGMNDDIDVVAVVAVADVLGLLYVAALADVA